jgi:predicted acyltransferase
MRDWFVALTAILVGYWAWFAATPIPDFAFDYSTVGVPPEWLRDHGLSGFAAHWQKNTNAAARFDQWFLNLFPLPTPHTGHWTGLTTLNFIPSMGTMILGLVAGARLRDVRGGPLIHKFCVAGVVLVTSGWLMGELGICPVVKAVWTPSWVLLSGGLCFLLLTAFHAVVDVAGFRRSAFPLLVIGMNSLVAYSMAHLYSALAFNAIRQLFGARTFSFLGDGVAPAVYGAAVLIAYWLVLYALYKLRLFIRL